MANSQTPIGRRKALKKLGIKLVEGHIHHRKTNPYLRKDLKRKIHISRHLRNYLQNVIVKTPFKDAHFAQSQKIVRQEIAARNIANPSA